jgi:glutamate-1-semialdehyde 2,1-aminomutase
MKTGQNLYQKAKQLIPGGTMLLSKRPEMFLPDQWPSYFSKAKGCHIWDLDGKKYTDMSIMGIGTNILGYGHPGVDDAVREVVKNGNVSTFNCPEEVQLAEKLVGMHPWSDMARFARTGGEANTIAIRIARAAAGRENVAFCGYHGWHDWYLAANLGDENQLAGHLLPGLEPNGVPQSLNKTIFPFTYNRFNELQEIAERHNPGVIMMEVSRNIPPEEGFLEKIRELADKKGMVLIFDEISSGFRQTFGGLHKQYGVEPDMAVFGKALGNGYAINAVIGKRSVMETAQSSFISSTFWTERIGPAAALKTLEVMERTSSWETISERGGEIKRRWKQLAERHNLEIGLSGLDALAHYSFKSDQALAWKTLITQTMLEHGILASNTVYVSTEHTPEITDLYFEKLDEAFHLISECNRGSKNIDDLLNGPVCHSGFKRIN